MADKTVIIKLDVQEAGAEAQIVSLTNKLSKLTEGEKDYELVLKKIAIQEDRLSKIQAKRATIQGNVLKETKNTTKQLNKQSDATGSATAATMELSRVVSDAPYGIRGMANNITQLVSQLGTASTKAGGLTNALKLMGKQLLGPLGIVFAITAVVSALDFFFGANTKAEKSLDGFRTSAAGAASDLKSLLIVMKEDMLSKEDLSNVIDKVNKKYKDLNLSIGEEGRLTKESIIQIDKKIASLGRLALANAMLTEIADIQGKVADAATELQRETSDELKELGLKNIADFRDTENQRADETKEAFIERRNQLIFYQKGDYKGQLDMEKSNTASKIRRELAAFDETKKRVATQVKELLKISTNEGFFEDFFNSKDEKGGSKSKGTIKLLDPKDFEGDLFEIEKMLRKFKHKELTLAAETEQQKGAVKALIELDNFKKEYSSYVESEDQKFDKFKENLEKETSAHKANLDKQLKAKKITQEEFNKAASDGQEARDTALAFAEEEFRDKSLVSYENYLKGLVAISDKYDRDIIGVGVTQFDTLAEQQRKAADRVLTGKLNVFQNQAESAKKILSSMTDFVNGEFDREMTIEQNKTNALNTELNNRLNNENLSKEQRRSIQNEIAQNDEKLRVKQEVIERKRFKMNKAANIANALMDTASAAAGVMAQAKGGFFARLAQAIPTIAFGLAQVATIARQKFQSSASKTPISTTIGGGAGSARAEPSFNIVGRSNDNILLSAIQSQFDQPLRAYVVARDVTNQQQLDGIIVNQAST